MNVNGAGTNGTYIAALIGTASGTTIKNVYITGAIVQNANANCGNGCGTGGIVGQATSSTTISTSYNAATITALSTRSGSVGGIVGYLDPGSSINRTYNIGTLTGSGIGALSAT